MFVAREQAPAWNEAARIFAADEGPWWDLHPRDVPLLTKIPRAFRTMAQMPVSRALAWNFSFPAARLAHPGVIEANLNVITPGGLATRLTLPTPGVVRLSKRGVAVFVDGQPQPQGGFELAAGEHWLMVFVIEAAGHNKEKSAWFTRPQITP